MKKFIIVTLLSLSAMSANASVICQSTSDPTFTARFPGYSCPPGYFMVGS